MNKQFSLKYKLVLLIFPLFLLYSVAQLLLFKNTVLESFLQIEADDSRRYANQVNAALGREVDALNTLCRDWAIWDDSYEFAVSGNTDYIDSNLYEGYVTSSEIHLFAVINPAGELVYGNGFDETTGEAYVLSGLGLSLSMLRRLLLIEDWSSVKPELSNTGFIQTDRGLLYFSARPIFTSSATGPARGILVIGRMLNQARLSQLAEQTGVKFELLTEGQILGSEQHTSVLAKLPLASSRGTHATDDMLFLYERVDDAFGEFLFLIEVFYPRLIVNEGLRTTQYSLMQSVVVGMLILFGIWVGTRVIVVTPLTKITRHLFEIRSKKDYNKRLSIDRNDEIGALTIGYNQLLDRISSQTQQLENLNEELVQISNTDSLTLVSNRRSFDTQFNKEIGTLHRRVKRAKPTGCLSLLVCDIDFFKQYNDTYGHSQGDDCLRRVAQAIKVCGSRPSDFTARYGGEEFVMLLPETPERGAIRVAEQIREAVLTLNIEHSASVISDHVTISIGIATMHTKDLVSADELFARADSALYQAKLNGKNRVELFQPPGDKISQSEGPAG